MALRAFLLFLFLTFGASSGNAGPPTPAPDIPKSDARTAEEPLALREAFQSQFSKDQLAQLEGQPTLAQLVEQMSPEQKQGARTKLGELEQNAKTPAELDEIAKGYLMLDEKAPDAGQGAIRIAEQLQQIEPENSRGFALAASGYHQSGDYPAATEWAKKALELNPNDERAKAVYMLSVGRIKRSGAGVPGVGSSPGAASSGGAFATQDWTIPEKDVSPQALALMKQAVLARKAGDFEKTFQLAQAAMNADPGSAGVQKFYGLVQDDQAKHNDTMEFLRLSKEAMDAGRGTEAVAWAQKASERSGNPTVYKILEIAKQRSDELAQEAVKQDLESRKKKPKNNLPLWPVGAGLGLAAVGYGVARSKSAWSGQESETPENEDPNSERIQRNRYRLKVAAISAAVGFGIVYGGPWLVGTAGPAVAAMLRGGNASVQRTLASEAGAINPSGKINPFAVRFSQDSINYRLRDAAGTKGAQTIDELVDALKSGRVLPGEIPPIRLVARNGQLLTLDNRRLEAFRRANIEIPYRMATPEEIATATKFDKFTSINGGTSIVVKGE